MNYLKCEDCKNIYSCEYTYLGGCTNGIEFEGENTMNNETKYRNVKMSLWKEICNKYKETDIVNCDGEIFYIDETHANHFIGRRILWSLELSNEYYKITPIIDKDDDGIEYVLTYKIELAD